jgi:integrase
MGRKRQRGERGRPWYWDKRGVWCVTHDKKRVVLRDREGQPVRGKDNEAKAVNVWHEMMTLARVPQRGDENELRTILELYLQSLEKRATEKTVADYRGFFRSFLAKWPGLLVRDLRPFHVERWWDDHPDDWGPSYRNMMGTALKAALNWAAKPGKGGGIIPKNPLDGMTLPSCRKRAATVVVERGEFARLMALVKSKAVRDVLTVLWETGARPGELAIATAANLEPDGSALIFAAHNTPEGSTVHKTFKKTGLARIVTLTDAAREVCLRLKLKHPNGPLFRTPRGMAWNKHRLANVILHYAKRAGLKGRFMAYSARHTRITEWLEAGMNDTDAAALAGNTPGIIAKNYSHVAARVNRLRELVNRHSPSKATGA